MWLQGFVSQAKAVELEDTQQELSMARAHLQGLEDSKGWLERRLNETEDNLNTTREDLETALQTNNDEHEQSIIRLNEEHLEEMKVGEA